MSNTVERLFCCECGTEVKPGAVGRVVPALQQGSFRGGSPRPHVWCQTCYGEEQIAAKARPKPGELSQAPTYQLHQYIWANGEGRTDKEIQLHWGYPLWGEKLSTLLRELTEACKIEKRDDRRVALCAPWVEPKAEPASGPGKVVGEGWVGVPENLCGCGSRAALVEVIDGRKQFECKCGHRFTTPARVEPVGERVPCYGQGGEIVDWAAPEEIEAAERADRRCADCSPPQQEARTREAHEVPRAPNCQVCGVPYADPACPHMDPRCGSCHLDCEEEAACSPPQPFDPSLYPKDDGLDPEALQADRYPVDPNDDRLMMIEKVLQRLLALTTALVQKPDPALDHFDVNAFYERLNRIETLLKRLLRLHREEP